MTIFYPVAMRRDDVARAGRHALARTRVDRRLAEVATEGVFVLRPWDFDDLRVIAQVNHNIPVGVAEPLRSTLERELRSALMRIANGGKINVIISLPPVTYTRSGV